MSEIIVGMHCSETPYWIFSIVKVCFSVQGIGKGKDIRPLKWWRGRRRIENPLPIFRLLCHQTKKNPGILPCKKKRKDLTFLGDGTEDDVPTCSTEYRMRKERSSKNWEALRKTLVKSSLQMEGFVPQICVECDCSKFAESRCRDFTAYYCLDCGNQTKHHFHQPEIKKVCFSFIDFKK